jgi:hypothetical protein
MGKKVRIAIEEVMDIQKRKRRINRLKLSSIIWTLNGNDVPVNPEIVREWEFTGLNNTDFIQGGKFMKLKKYKKPGIEINEVNLGR